MMYRDRRKLAFYLTATAVLLIGCVDGFVSSQLNINVPQRNPLWYGKEEFDAGFFDSELLHERLRHLRVGIIEEDIRRPPNAKLSPNQLVQEIMQGLLHPFDPLPYAGFRLMLRAATKSWRKKILQSVGANETSDWEIVAPALDSAIGRPHNQFAILVGEGEDYCLEFLDPVNYEDGTCWVECKLRDKTNRKLLVITGWDLRQQDGAWFVDRIDWQDFRDEFRPGVGREEWLRDECF
eukprot:scaffold8240_cov133-Cylindrotheca_fusiformis.AAC.5